MSPRRTYMSEILETTRFREETALLLWMRKTETSQHKFAQMVEAGISTVKKWMFGMCMPSLVAAFKIEKATAGGVPVASWLGTSLGKAYWAEKKCDWKKINYRKKNPNLFRTREAINKTQRESNERRRVKMSGGTPNPSRNDERAMHASSLRRERIARESEGAEEETSLGKVPDQTAG